MGKMHRKKDKTDVLNTKEVIKEKISESIENNNNNNNNNNVNTSYALMKFVTAISLLVAIIALEVLLGILVLKQPAALLAVIMCLNIVMGIFVKDFHYYYVSLLSTIQLITGGLTNHMLISTLGVVLLIATWAAFKKLINYSLS